MFLINFYVVMKWYIKSKKGPITMKKNLTIEQKKKYVIDDYNAIVQEYTEEFFDDKSDE